jgi:hypothetical protein
LRVNWELINYQFWFGLVRIGPKANLIFGTKIRAELELDSWFHLCVGGTGTRTVIILINFFLHEQMMFFFIIKVKNYLVQLCNKHYPIAECWMDDMNLNKHYPITKCWMDGESTRSQQSSLRLVVMPWTNFQTHRMTF